MAGSRSPSWVERHLDPGERLGEILFGLVMVLTFTLTAGLSVTEGREGVRALLTSAIGCNIAWGIIDGVFYVMGGLFHRGRRVRIARAIRSSADEKAAEALVASELEPTLEEVASPEERRRLYRDIVQVVRRSAPARVGITRDDLWGALASFWLVVLSTIPAALPFLVFREETRFALRVSNGLLIALIFLVGFRWARYTGGSGWRTGAALAAMGIALVAVAFALGG
ncbi:MAG TPA: VIT family protein [Candidatus Polarisedimenticolia bacterium]|nr:VIT family protein [Candidatus Polarisedimenticolia bacterium]